MSFVYNRTTITLDNYKKIFGVCTPDILDEIRSAVLDDTNISAFIQGCGNDNYKLGQLRMAAREYIPIEYLDTKLTGKTIYYIRQGFAKGYDMSNLLRYIETKGSYIDESTVEKLAMYCFMGVDISKVDFMQVPVGLVDLYCKGLYKGYPMWLCLGRYMGEEELKLLMEGMALGIDIHPFIAESWDLPTIATIFSKVSPDKMSALLSCINSKFDLQMVDLLIVLQKRNAPFENLCVKDEEGFPIYNYYQMYEIAQAICDGTVTNEMYNPELSDFEIAQLHDKQLALKGGTSYE